MDALRSAQTSLAINAARSASVAANVGRAGEEGYARRDVPTTTDLTGARALRVRRAHDGALEASLLAARSAAANAQARAGGMNELRSLLGGPDAEGSPHALIGDLRGGMQRLAASPGSPPGAAAAVDRARDLANGLNRMSRGIEAVRAAANEDIARDVDALGALLARFADENGAVVAASRRGLDGSDAADARDRTLLAIGDLVGVHARERAHGDLVLLAGGPGGPVLHEAIGRPIGSPPGAPGAGAGGPVLIDGQAVGEAIGGRIGAALALRDRIAPAEARRMDALAAALIDAFSDTDGASTAPGLFVDTGTGPTAGLAGRIAVNPAVDPERGGDPFALRDGVSGGPAAGRNPSRDPGFAALLIERIEGLEAPRAFDPALGLGADASLLGAAGALLGQIDRARSNALGASEGASLALDRAATAHSDAVGVNVDEEMALLIEIEQSHRASARIIAAVDGMLQDILAMTR